MKDKHAGFNSSKKYHTIPTTVPLKKGNTS